MNFEELKAERYVEAPFDLTTNRRGFMSRPGSDISAHLPFLEFVASQCDHCTELGVRSGYSTVALLSGARKRVVSYDIEKSSCVERLLSAGELPCQWEFQLADTSSRVSVGEIEETDFLFVDTLHTSYQVKRELALFGPHVRRFIGFHDTYSQGENSLDRPGELGINAAIEEFIEFNPWKTVYRVDFNHGLWLIERKF